MSASILVLEDDPASLELVEYLLGAEGYNVISACRGDDGLELAREYRPDLILCDIQLPGLDGYGVARAINSDPVLRDIPIIAVTALAMVGERERVLAAGFDSYIAKPIEPSSFSARIEPFLQSTQRRQPMSTPAPSADELAASPRGITLLVVDDTQSNLDLKRGIFEPLGYTVLTAGTATEGLSLAIERAPHLVISDIDLPDMTGFELLRRMRFDARLRGIPVLVVTATYTDTGARETALSMGATDFLVRPVEPQVLIGVVQACLRTNGGCAWQRS